MPGEKPTAKWDIAQPALQPWVDRADIVVTTEELSSLFFLGHYDVRFSPSKLGEQAPGNRDEFSRDFRTGRPIIGTNASMRLILDCFASGVVFGPIVDWGKPHLINPELTEIIQAAATPIELPAKQPYVRLWLGAGARPARRGRLRRHPRGAPEAAHDPALRLQIRNAVGAQMRVHVVDPALFTRALRHPLLPGAGGGGRRGHAHRPWPAFLRGGG